ncbi:hypothetical protein PC129_g22796 [Phytophthora cactorum]|uniref:Uncharacterized protein n=1 Tax=Phytophthora cactorum TaxID=29920 RepID=A0A8T1JS66_9STRA|nr:hypothetical protein PC129_g22796 [Phytophthora cactorum]KAG4040738.1 hypothetical protein PC123_g23725 [Phytophthora cactorum]KAG4225835.1 hypothetical protein PC116_g25750 [Phytophthora cactorum]
MPSEPRSKKHYVRLGITSLGRNYTRDYQELLEAFR